MAGAGWAPPRLDEFILTERLGSGTYATVYKAYRKKNAREVVAIKCVNKKSLNRASVENLLTEIEILKTVRHPHIVELKDFQVKSSSARADWGFVGDVGVAEGWLAGLSRLEDLEGQLGGLMGVCVTEA
uniref:non-specific serine/threonine protein kinase n=1 Tax=Chelonoidis abingdonii TaxID=106734 RepID=A0A8C0IZR4_CHEAB